VLQDFIQYTSPRSPYISRYYAVLLHPLSCLLARYLSDKAKDGIGMIYASVLPQIDTTASPFRHSGQAIYGGMTCSIMFGPIILHDLCGTLLFLGHKASLALFQMGLLL
jgi:hypothetical protein